MPERWQFWIDRGGTFTDVVARRPDGALVTHKLLSENPERYADAAIAGIREILSVREAQAIPAHLIEAVKMGTTVATNALLERKGEPTVLFITRGFRDALRIAYQNRPRIFERHIVLPEMLYSKVVEVNERVAARGEVASRVVRTLRRLRIGSVAVFSDADASAKHVREADRGVRIGESPAHLSYLNPAAVVGAGGCVVYESTSGHGVRKLPLDEYLAVKAPDVVHVFHPRRALTDEEAAQFDRRYRSSFSDIAASNFSPLAISSSSIATVR